MYMYNAYMIYVSLCMRYVQYILCSMRICVFTCVLAYVYVKYMLCTLVNVYMYVYMLVHVYVYICVGCVRICAHVYIYMYRHVYECRLIIVSILLILKTAF